MPSLIECRVTYNGGARAPSVHVPKISIKSHFSKERPNIVVELDDKIAYTCLTADFFSHVGQIRTLYPSPSGHRENLLVSWMKRNGLKMGDEVTLEVIKPYSRFRLRRC